MLSAVHYLRAQYAVYRDKRFVRIFGRVLWKEDVKEHWGRSRVNARLALCVNISETVRDTSKVTVND